MFANPEVASFIDRLVGGAPSRGGGPPSGQGSRATLARALLGEVTPAPLEAGFTAPAIDASRHVVTAPQSSAGVNHGIGSQEQQSAPNSAQTHLGYTGIGTGLERLGTGIETAIGELGTARKRQDDLEALRGSFPKFGGGVETISVPQSSTGEKVANSDDETGRFLTGITTAEGVPSYSGFSSTGAIGPYGLTHGFIQQWGPGAGLPTDRQSYIGNKDAQDALARYAASQMHSQYGDWKSVANAWLTGSPTATSSAPGNMSPSAYDAKVLNSSGIGPQSMLAAPQANPLAMALSGGQLPPVDPNFGGGNVLFG